MRVLLVEDDKNKTEQLVAFLQQEIPFAVVVHKGAVDDAIKALESNLFDLVLLDMSLPVFDYAMEEDGFAHLPVGGRDVIDAADRLGRECRVVVVTALDRFGKNEDAVTLQQLDAELRAEYGSLYAGKVWYTAHSDRWKGELRSLLADVRPDGWSGTHNV